MSRRMQSTVERSAIRVLIVDDQTMMREGLRALLAACEGITVVGETDDGSKAVALVEEQRPDVVIMDVSMPGMDGYEATRQIVERCPETRVLILTMHEDARHFFPGMEAGASGFVVKNAAPEELAHAIRTVAAGKAFLHPAVAGHAVQGLTAPKARRGADGLTRREWEVLQQIALGYTNREIADRLYISIKTVETHRERILTKLDCRSRAELVAFAIEEGLLDDACGAA